MHKAHIAGTGRYRPQYSYDNAFMATFVGAPPVWSADQIERRLGIKNRRFAVEMSHNTGKAAVEFDEVQMAAEAAKEALKTSGREPKDIDLLIFVSCTAQRGERRHFSRSAFDLYLRLGLESHCRIHEMDAGCGGALHALDSAWEAIGSGRRKAALIVASSCPSQYMDRAFYQRTGSYLSAIIFGDGAGAVVLAKAGNGAGIIDSVTSVDPAVPLMGLRGDPKNDPELAYWIDGKGVKQAFGIYAKSSFERLKAKVPEVANADAYIFHQVNANVLREFVDDMGLPVEKVPINVDSRGNIAAAATLDILDEEIEMNRLGKGSLVVICAVGAGAQAGAMALRL